MSGPRLSTSLHESYSSCSESLGFESVCAVRDQFAPLAAHWLRQWRPTMTSDNAGVPGATRRSNALSKSKKMSSGSLPDLSADNNAPICSGADESVSGLLNWTRVARARCDNDAQRKQAVVSPHARVFRPAARETTRRHAALTAQLQTVWTSRRSQHRRQRNNGLGRCDLGAHRIEIDGFCGR